MLPSSWRWLECAAQDRVSIALYTTSSPSPAHILPKRTIGLWPGTWHSWLPGASRCLLWEAFPALRAELLEKMWKYLCQRSSGVDISKRFHLEPNALLSQPQPSPVFLANFPEPILALRSALSQTEQVESQEGQGQIYTTLRKKKGH